MSFFDAAPPPEPQREIAYRPPEWMEPPDNVMPISVGIDAFVARRDDLAVWVAGAQVYRTGLTFSVVIALRPGPEPRRPQRPWFPHPGEPDGPRFGVGFADGRRAEVGRAIGFSGDGPPDIMLTQRGSSGSEHRWRGGMWLWPLPPAGPLTFALAWPEEAVEETTVDVDSGPIAEASARAIELWPDERPLRPRGGDAEWTTYGPG